MLQIHLQIPKIWWFSNSKYTCSWLLWTSKINSITNARGPPGGNAQPKHLWNQSYIPNVFLRFS